MSDFHPEIDWQRLKQWQIWDPIPWWILDREKLEQILVKQLEFKIQIMEQQIAQMREIHHIVAGKGR